MPSIPTSTSSSHKTSRITRPPPTFKVDLPATISQIIIHGPLRIIKGNSTLRAIFTCPPQNPVTSKSDNFFRAVKLLEVLHFKSPAIHHLPTIHRKLTMFSSLTEFRCSRKTIPETEFGIHSHRKVEATATASVRWVIKCFEPCCATYWFANSATTSTARGNAKTANNSAALWISQWSWLVRKSQSRGGSWDWISSRDLREWWEEKIDWLKNNLIFTFAFRQSH